MGMMDHTRTWHFRVAAEPEACRAAFEKAVTKSPGLKLRAVKWDLRRDFISPQPGSPVVEASVATYTGRAGFAAFSTAIAGARAEKTEDGAIGSEMTFVVDTETTTSGRTCCSMWMAKRGTTFGFTNDAGYFRSYMSDVEKGLRALDPNLDLAKS